MKKLVKPNWSKKFKEFYSTPEKEKILNKHLLLVLDENPGAFREEIFSKLEVSLNHRRINES
tara:strand:- start:204 stop:389 length:186 start_codon:yes stop_codon:yes gene_type:complete